MDCNIIPQVAQATPQKKEEVISLASLHQRQSDKRINKATVLLTLTLFQTHTLIHTQPYSKFVSEPILKKKVLTKCHSEVSEIIKSSRLCLLPDVSL